LRSALPYSLVSLMQRHYLKSRNILIGIGSWPLISSLSAGCSAEPMYISCGLYVHCANTIYATLAYYLCANVLKVKYVQYNVMVPRPTTNDCHYFLLTHLSFRWKTLKVPPL
jgi:hypothetical protein